MKVLLTSGWSTVRASGWWELHHLEHAPCGLRTAFAYDLIRPDDVRNANAVIANHNCQES